MKKITVKEQIFSFLQNNPSVWHNGQLQKMDFITRRNGSASGDTIRRRLDDLVDEKRIEMIPNARGENQYSIKSEFKKKPAMIYDDTHPIWDEERKQWKGQFRYAQA